MPKYEVFGLGFTVSVLLGCLDILFKEEYEWGKGAKGFFFKVYGDITNDTFVSADIRPVTWRCDDEPYISCEFSKDERGCWTPAKGFVYAPHIESLGIKHHFFSVIEGKRNQPPFVIKWEDVPRILREGE